MTVHVSRENSEYLGQAIGDDKSANLHTKFSAFRNYDAVDVKLAGSQ